MFLKQNNVNHIGTLNSVSGFMVHLLRFYQDVVIYEWTYNVQ